MMLSELFEGFGIVDILLILNYFQSRKQTKLARKSNRLALTLAALQESDQHELIELLKEIRDQRR